MPCLGEQGVVLPHCTPKGCFQRLGLYSLDPVIFKAQACD